MRWKHRDNRGCADSQSHKAHILLREEVVSCGQMLMSPTELEFTSPTYKHADSHTRCFVTLFVIHYLCTFLSSTVTETHTDTLNKYILHNFIHRPFGHPEAAGIVVLNMVSTPYHCTKTI